MPDIFDQILPDDPNEQSRTGDIFDKLLPDDVKPSRLDQALEPVKNIGPMAVNQFLGGIEAAKEGGGLASDIAQEYMNEPSKILTAPVAENLANVAKMGLGLVSGGVGLGATAATPIFAPVQALMAHPITEAGVQTGIIPEEQAPTVENAITMGVGMGLPIHPIAERVISRRVGPGYEASQNLTPSAKEALGIAPEEVVQEQLVTGEPPILTRKNKPYVSQEAAQRAMSSKMLNPDEYEVRPHNEGFGIFKKEQIFQEKPKDIFDQILPDETPIEEPVRAELPPEEIVAPEPAPLEQMSVQDILKKKPTILSERPDVTPAVLNDLIIKKQAEKLETGKIEPIQPTFNKPEAIEEELNKPTESPLETFERIGKEDALYGKELDALPEGSILNVSAIPGAKALEGKWIKKNVGGDPFWFNEKTDEYRASEQLRVAKSYGADVNDAILPKTPPVVPAAETTATTVATEAEKPRVVEGAPEPTAPEGKKEPWEMTKGEWDKERAKVRPETFGSAPHKASISREVAQMKRLEELLYGVSDEASAKMKAAIRGEIKLTPEEVEQYQERINTPIFHKDVVAKALSEGKSVPPEVLADYPDLQPKAETKVDINTLKNIEVPDYALDLSVKGKIKLGEMYPSDLPVSADRAEKAGDTKTATLIRDYTKLWRTEDRKRLEVYHNELSEKQKAAKEIRDELRENRYKIKYNAPNATLTVWHGTTPENKATIMESGRFEEMSFFSHARDKSAFGSGGAKGYGKAVFSIDVDPRDIDFNSGSGEIEAPDGLIRDTDGIWKSPKRIEKPESVAVAPSPIAKTTKKGLTPGEKMRGGQITRPYPTSPKKKNLFAMIEHEVLSGRPGYRKPNAEGKWGGFPSTYPDYFKNKGYTKANVIEILKRIKKGDTLTDNQRDIANDLYKEKRQEILREILSDREVARTAREEAINDLAETYTEGSRTEAEGIYDEIDRHEQQVQVITPEGGGLAPRRYTEAEFDKALAQNKFPWELEEEAPKEVAEETPPVKKGVTLASGLGGLQPSLEKFAEQDLMPALKTTAKSLGDAGRDIRKVLAPSTVSKEAKATAGIMRETLAEMQRSSDRAQAALNQAKVVFDKMPQDKTIDFVDNMESGSSQGNPQLDSIANTIRPILDSRRDAIQALGTGKLEKFIENYFPHIWKDPEKAANFFQQWFGRRPFEGKKSFLKKRTIPTMREGIDEGFEPVSWNPVDLVMIKAREMDKYLMAHKTMGEMKEGGLLKYVKATQKAPEGWAKIDDRIGTVYAPPDLQVTSKGGAKIGTTILGYYYAPADAARIVNNYLSPGLRGSAMFRGYLEVANLMNQAQLGFSAFHLGFTSLDAMTSRVALGLIQASHGDIGHAVSSIATSPTAPLTNIMRGNKVLKEWFSPGSQGAEVAKIIDGLTQAGGRVKMDQFYRTRIIENMMRAFRSGNYLGGLLRTPFALMEAVAKPVMEYVVPRQKLGTFADLARYELEHLEQKGAPREEIRASMQKIWDSVDNRMGQMVYDNIFWNKTLKDLSMASVRSVGWNLGTIRELGGAVIDTLAQGKNLLTGKNTELTYRMSYLIALPIATGFIGAITNYLMTGEGPKELKDYFFPMTGEIDKDGNPVRVSLPSYIKDIVHYVRSPYRTITNKIHPAIGIIADMLMNKDYFGTEIRNAEDPIVKQLADEVSFIGKQNLPFSVQGLMKNIERNEKGLKVALPFVGVTPAPADIQRTPMQNEIIDLSRQRRGTPMRSQEQAEKTKLRGEIKQAYINHDMKTFNDKLMEGIQKGYLNDRNFRSLLIYAERPSDVNAFYSLPDDDQSRLLAKMKPSDRTRYLPYAKVQAKLDYMKNIIKK